jgi:hypothetical protein
MNYDPNQPTSGRPQDPSGPPPYGQQPSGQPQWPPTGHVPPPYGSEYVPPQQQPPYQQPQPEYVPPQQPPYQQPQYGIPPFPNYAQPQQPKRSLRWLWITLAIVGGILVLACAGCGIFLYVAGKAAINAAGPALTTQAYYQFVKQKNYARAYTLLDSNATVSIAGKSLPAPNQQSFTAAAQAIDASAGPVSNFSVHTNGSDTSHLTVTVTRRSQTYDVHLTLAPVGGSWKITSLDGI